MSLVTSLRFYGELTLSINEDLDAVCPAVALCLALVEAVVIGLEARDQEGVVTKDGVATELLYRLTILEPVDGGPRASCRLARDADLAVHLMFHDIRQLVDDTWGICYR